MNGRRMNRQSVTTLCLSSSLRHSFIEELELKEGYILVSEGYEDIKAGNAVIHVRPAHEFLICLV